MLISKVMTESATATSTSTVDAGAGRAHHSATEQSAMITVNTNSHGLRGPPLSAMAPSTGLISAVARAAMLIASPHCAVPSVSLGAIARVNYDEITKVVTTVM